MESVLSVINMQKQIIRIFLITMKMKKPRIYSKGMSAIYTDGLCGNNYHVLISNGKNLNYLKIMILNEIEDIFLEVDLEYPLSTE